MLEPRCYNCGAAQASTREHVIPRAPVPEPRPSNLPTVPACVPCNQGFSKDEEYLRDRLAVVMTGSNYAGPDLWEIAWRSMQRREAKGKKFGLFKDIRQLASPVFTEEGPSDLAVVIRKDRANRVIEKMVRALFYHLVGRRLEDTSFEWMDILSVLRPGRDVVKVKKVLDHVSCVISWKQKFGPHTWVACDLAEDDRRAGIWLIGLFGGHLIVALTLPSESARSDHSSGVRPPS